MSHSLACGVYSPAAIASLGRYAVRDAHNGRFTRAKASTPVKAPTETEEPHAGHRSPLNANHAKAAFVIFMLLSAVYHILYVRIFLL